MPLDRQAIDEVATALAKLVEGARASGLAEGFMVLLQEPAVEGGGGGVISNMEESASLELALRFAQTRMDATEATLIPTMLERTRVLSWLEDIAGQICEGPLEAIVKTGLNQLSERERQLFREMGLALVEGMAAAIRAGDHADIEVGVMALPVGTVN
jgi:hypothetical protein